MKLRRWTCLPLLLLAFAVQSFAQAPQLALAGIAHVALRVGDLDRSRAFYQQLGFVVAFAMSKDGKPTEAFLKINDRQFIELYPQRGPDQPIGFMHLCFESSALPALHSAYAAQGLPPTAVKKAGAGNLLFTMRGPEQQNIEYTQYMPGSMHTMDRGLHLGPDRIATQFVGVTIPMVDPAAATTFYQSKLGFTAAPAVAGTQAFGSPALPASSSSSPRPSVSSSACPIPGRLHAHSKPCISRSGRLVPPFQSLILTAIGSSF